MVALVGSCLEAISFRIHNCVHRLFKRETASASFHHFRRSDTKISHLGKEETWDSIVLDEEALGKGRGVGLKSFHEWVLSLFAQHMG